MRPYFYSCVVLLEVISGLEFNIFIANSCWDDVETPVKQGKLLMCQLKPLRLNQNIFEGADSGGCLV